jgi:predicted RNA-binding protein
MLEKDGQKEKVMDSVAKLIVTAEGIQINALFEPPELLAGARLKEIDFLDGVVVLTQD